MARCCELPNAIPKTNSWAVANSSSPVRATFPFNAFIELTVKLKAKGQIRPTAARTHMSNRQTRKWNAAHQGEPRTVLLSHEQLTSAGLNHERIVFGAPDIEVRGTQDIRLQTRKPLWIRMDRHSLEETRQMGVCDDLFDVSVAAFRVLPFNPVSQARWHALNVGLQISRLLMEERFPIGEKKLDIPHLRCVDGRIIDLGHDAVPDGKPDPTGSRVGRADPILVAVRPTRLKARPAKCVIISSNSCHRRVPKLGPMPSLWSERAPAFWGHG